MDNLLLDELIVATKRADIEQCIVRDRMVELAGKPEGAGGLRAFVASAIVRLGLVVDPNAGRRAAAPQPRGATHA